AADAMYKVGVIMQDKGDTAKAKAVYQQVINKYPGTDGAKQAHTLVIAPSLPANDTPLFSIAALWLAMQQILIGIALGFTMQFAF
ncbi:tetratricopeptide repeat protein, partial [Salmonella enterica subsp. enterica serovar Anatum]|nr:tetratricopeptide repeat protein [Salmonella enterica subsp. enterica serovar Anatum]